MILYLKYFEYFSLYKKIGYGVKMRTLRILYIRGNVALGAAFELKK